MGDLKVTWDFRGESIYLKQSTVRYILINGFNDKGKKFHPMEKWSEVLNNLWKRQPKVSTGILNFQRQWMNAHLEKQLRNLT